MIESDIARLERGARIAEAFGHHWHADYARWRIAQMRASAAPADRSGEAGETGTGSTEGESAVAGEAG